MIKVYKIKVEEKVYEVEVESVTEKEGVIQGTKKIKESNRVIETSKDISQSEGEKIESPMQGIVISVDVKVGDKVKSGDTIVVIEAMKMENPIVANIDGEVTSINVSSGDKVEGGAVIATIA